MASVNHVKVNLKAYSKTNLQMIVKRFSSVPSGHFRKCNDKTKRKTTLEKKNNIT